MKVASITRYHVDHRRYFGPEEKPQPVTERFPKPVEMGTNEINALAGAGVRINLLC